MRRAIEEADRIVLVVDGRAGITATDRVYDGTTSVAVDVVAPYLSRGELVRVLAPWITGRFTLYAAMPSRKFVPVRTRIFLEFLIDQTRKYASDADRTPPALT